MRIVEIALKIGDGQYYFFKIRFQFFLSKSQRLLEQLVDYSCLVKNLERITGFIINMHGGTKMMRPYVLAAMKR